MTDDATSMLRDITIDGQELTVEVPYTEGHQLTAAEASQLNQVYIENIGNNFRKKVRELLEAGKGVEEIQKELDAYADSYTFGVRRVGGGGKRVADPVEREIRSLAKKALGEHFAKRDIKFSELSADDKEQAIKTYIGKYADKLRPIAERRIADAAALAAVE